MTYLAPHRTSWQKNRWPIIVIGVVVLAIVGIQVLMPHFFAAFWTSLTRPFWRLQFSVMSGSVRTPEQLLDDNESLRRQIEEMKIQLASTQFLADENESLKAAMGRASSTPDLLAAVLMRPPSTLYDELIIDVGADHHVKVGDKVYAPGNVLLGRVSEVLGQTSKVTLFSSAGQEYQVLIGASHLPSTATGRGGGQYEANVPRDIKVQVGDYVISPSLDDKPFGIVSAIQSDPAEPFETLLFAPPVNIYNVRWVLVNSK